MVLRVRLLKASTTALLAVALVLCAPNCEETSNKDFLGSAVVDSRSYSVATTVQGQIVELYKDEGRAVRRDELIAILDTVQQCLMRMELESGIRELEATIFSKEADVKSLAASVDGAEREYNRIRGLVESGAAPEQQRDNLRTQLQTAQLNLVSARRMIVSLREKKQGMIIRLREINDRIGRSYVRSPAGGVVVTRYRSRGEVVGPGNPIVEVGEFDTLYADFFVPQTMLAAMKLGQSVRIRVDYDDPDSASRAKFLPAQITWISNEAEFSPKNIQTRQSRNELVFRVRATIPNRDGILKRGLPVEVWR